MYPKSYQVLRANLLTNAVAFFSLIIASTVAQATIYEGIDFPAGAASFADVVILYEPNLGDGPIPSLRNQEVQRALGLPRQPSDLIDASLGNGGRITLQFTDNSLVGSGDATPDLWVFEVGSNLGAVDEPTFVEISRDGIIWHPVGITPGATSGIDIDAFGFGRSDYFSFVRLTDIDSDSSGTGSVGADIDAVGASSSGSRVVPQPEIGQLIYYDDFNAGGFESNWFSGATPPDGVDSITIVDGRVQATTNRTFIQTQQDFAGNFRVEFDLEKVGEGTHSGFDFAIELTALPETAGIIRFDFDGVDGAAIGPSPSISGAVGDAVTIDGAGVNKGTAILTFEKPYLDFVFVNEEGAVLKVERVLTGDFDSTNIRLHLAAFGDSPRYVDNFKVYSMAPRLIKSMLNVAAYIDGRSQLAIQGKKAQWLHLDYAAPGRHLGRDDPTFLNGAAFYPVWPTPGENRDCNCYSSSYEFINPPLPADGKPLQLDIVRARHEVAIIEIVQQPTEENGHTLVVEFNNNPLGGADWYTINVVNALTVVNDKVTFGPDASTYSFTPDASGCPGGFVGKFGFDAQLTNIRQSTLADLHIEVEEIGNGNLLLTEAGTTIGEGDTFSVAEMDSYADGILAPSKYVDVPFMVCLKNTKPFRFFVDVLGVVSKEGLRNSLKVQ